MAVIENESAEFQEAEAAVKMNVETLIRCPHCKQTLKVAHMLLGVGIRCMACSQPFWEEAEWTLKDRFPDTEYEIEFRDLEVLLAQNSRHLRAVLKEWFGLQVRSRNGVVRVLDGEVYMDLLTLHLKIQNDPVKQRQMYGIAMAFFRF